MDNTNVILKSYPNVLDVQPDAISLLQQIQTVFPSAFIAGGYLRDLWLNGVPKDIDIWIPVANPFGMYDLFAQYDNLSCADAVLHELGDTQLPAEVIQTHGCLYESMGDGQDRVVLGIYRTETLTGFPVDIIMFDSSSLDTATDFVRSFDINICQIIMQDPGCVLYTSEFLNGVLTKTLRVCHANRSDRNKTRVCKLLDKYKDFTEDTSNAPLPL